MDIKIKLQNVFGAHIHHFSLENWLYFGGSNT